MAASEGRLYSQPWKCPRPRPKKILALRASVAVVVDAQPTMVTVLEEKELVSSAGRWTHIPKKYRNKEIT